MAQSWMFPKNVVGVRDLAPTKKASESSKTPSPESPQKVDDRNKKKSKYKVLKTLKKLLDCVKTAAVKVSTASTLHKWFKGASSNKATTAAAEQSLKGKMESMKQQSIYQEQPPKEFGRALRKYFFLDERYLSLNHGSFGVIPRPVRDAQHALQARIEANPDMFYKFELAAELDATLSHVAPLLGAQVDDLVFIQNASFGVNSAFRSLRAVLKHQGKPVTAAEWHAAGGKGARKILQLSTVYPFVNIATHYTASNEGDLQVLTLPIQHPISESQLLDLVRTAILKERSEGSDVAMAVFDAITSVPGVINPWESLVKLCRSLGVFTVIDGAHAIGQIPLTHLKSVDPDVFVTNLHKWLFAPRGAAVMYVSPRCRPWVTHAVTTATYGNSDWRSGFHWTGTVDVCNYVSVVEALKFRQWLGGEQKVMDYNKKVAVQGGELVAKMWGTFVLKGPEGTGERTSGHGLYASMVNVRVPETETVRKGGDEFMSKIQERLMREYMCSAQVFKHVDAWYVRFSAQVYVDLDDFEKVGRILLDMFNGVSSSAKISIAGDSFNFNATPRL
ncbi:hypothetical protein HDV05_006084 [Chytridiales sp. JEL 0842]|nr:hypothetical protein HDV05_006084 [Chytridiales sp. JEL 0842]